MAFKLSSYDAQSKSAGAVADGNVPKANAADMGGQSGAALKNLGGDIQQAGNTINRRTAAEEVRSKAEIAAALKVSNRVDTISRTRIVNQYNEQINAESVRRNSETDMSDPENGKEFGSKLREWGSAALASYEGGDVGRTMLINQIDDMRSKESLKFGNAVGAKGRELVDSTLSNSLNGLVNTAVLTGDLSSAFTSIDNEVTNASPGMGNDKAMAHSNSAKGSVIKGLVEKHLTEGNPEEATALLQTPGIENYLDPASMQTLRNSIITEQAQKDKGAALGKQKLEEAATILGVKVEDLTPEQRVNIANVQEDDTPQEKIAKLNTAYKLQTGQDMTTKMVEKALGIFVKPDVDAEGKFTRAGARRITNDLGRKILDGTATDEEKDEFNTATAELTRPTFMVDSDGMRIAVDPNLSQLTKDAMKELGVGPGGGPLAAATGDGVVSPVGGQNVAQQELVAPVEFRDTTVALLGRATGLASYVSNTISNIPVFGDIFPAQDVNAARAQLERQSRTLVDVYRLSNRGITEIKELEEMLSIGPKAFTTQTAAIGRLIGLEKDLTQRIEDSEKTLKAGNLARLDRNKLRQFVYKAQNFVDNLGLPPRFKTFKDARKALDAGKAQPGSVFMITMDDGENKLMKMPMPEPGN